MLSVKIYKWNDKDQELAIWLVEACIRYCLGVYCCDHLCKYMIYRNMGYQNECGVV